jgi:soluble lytic murein transglycosylase
MTRNVPSKENSHHFRFLAKAKTPTQLQNCYFSKANWLIISIILIAMSTNAVATNSLPSETTKTHIPSLKKDLFIEAENALRDKQYAIFEKLLSQLQDHPLKDYLYRDLLLNRLKNNPQSAANLTAIKGFLKAHHGEVVSRKLRYLWLDHLATTGQETVFLDYYQPTSSIVNRCRALEYQLKKRTNLADLQPKIASIWLTSDSLPKKCDPMLEVWKNNNGLTESLIWERMILAVQERKFSLARYLNNQRDAHLQPSGTLLINASKRPKNLAVLLSKYKPPRQVNNRHFERYITSIAYYSLLKLAWSDAHRTISLWRLLDQELSLSEIQIKRLKRNIALSLAIQKSPDATQWLSSVANHADESIDQWLLSTLLVNHQKGPIEPHIANLASKQTQSDKWSYWLAIMGLDESRILDAKDLLSNLAQQRSYYGFLAAIESNQQPNLNNRSSSSSSVSLADLKAKPAAKRAYAFFLLERFHQARSEWNHLKKQTAKKDLVYLAELAHEWGWNHQSILAFAKSKQIDDVEKRFPFFQRQDFEHATSTYDIPISWAYAITRQESAFKIDARSHAGARGLMQLKPSTARQVAKRQKVKHSKQTIRQLLNDPKMNIKLGVAHLKEMLDYYQGNPILATAAYNAGKHRVNQWLLNNQISDSLVWIEQIPYKETREYVKNVLTYEQIYAQLEGENSSYLNRLSNFSIPTAKQQVLDISTR